MMAFFINSLILALVTYLQLGVLYFEIALFSTISCVGIVLPNTTAKALEFQAERAGVASALMGSIQFLVGSIGTVFVTSLSHWREWSMVTGMVTFVTISFFIFISSSLTENRSSVVELGSA